VDWMRLHGEIYETMTNEWDAEEEDEMQQLAIMEVAKHTKLLVIKDVLAARYF